MSNKKIHKVYLLLGLSMLILISVQLFWQTMPVWLGILVGVIFIIILGAIPFLRKLTEETE